LEDDLLQFEIKEYIKEVDEEWALMKRVIDLYP
jgi:hypothetical protein